LTQKASTSLLTLVIPTRDRARRLEVCLGALCLQYLHPEKWEVIVVDNGSRDITREIVQLFCKKIQLRCKYVADVGLHFGRHEGIRHSESNIIVFADDDTMALPTWLESIVDCFSNPKVAIVGGNNLPNFEASVSGWLDRLWRRRVYMGQALWPLSILNFGDGMFEIDPVYVWGCNFAIRRDVLLRAGGFHPDGFPKELLRFRGDGETHVANFVRKSGMKTVFNSNASVYHQVPKERMTKDYFCKRYYAQGISDSYSVIRACGGVLDAGQKLKRTLQVGRGIGENFIRKLKAKGDPVDREVADLLSDARRAYDSGYRFHQKEVARDPELRAWVLKSSYL